MTSAVQEETAKQSSARLILVKRAAPVEDVVWNATEKDVGRVVPEATVSCSVRVMQRSVSSGVQLTGTSASSRVFNVVPDAQCESW